MAVVVHGIGHKVPGRKEGAGYESVVSGFHRAGKTSFDALIEIANTFGLYGLIR